MVFASFAEILSLAAVLPFLGILTSPDKAFSHPWASFFLQALDLREPTELLLPITVVFAAAAFLSGAMRFLLLWAQTRLSHAVGADFSLQMYRRTLGQPYAVHVARNSSEVIAGISNKAKAIVGSTLLPALTIASSVMLLGTILMALIHIEPFITLLALAGFGSIYILVIRATRRQLLQNSEQISEGQTAVIKVLQEGLGGIRDVLLDGTQELHCNLYRSIDAPLRKAVANVQIISVSPRYGVEALGMILIAFLAYLLMVRSGGATSAIPILGAFAMGAQRMLPMLQQSYSGWVAIRSGQILLQDALDLMEQPLPAYAKGSRTISFERNIALRNVSFAYDSTGPKILKDLNLSIPKGARVGIIGTTGSGKSTLLDILMGLLTPTSGCLLVDGLHIGEGNIAAWQKRIAHVPQTIFLSDASIEDNIKLGSPKTPADPVRLAEAARSAQLTDMIDSLDEGWGTVVGERGVRLSGGQRQRIGIARALYKRADLLILDEATSALDNETESNVMRAIESTGQNTTVIIVAHRLSTLKNCDLIVQLEAGQIKQVGTFAQVISS